MVTDVTDVAAETGGAADAAAGAVVGAAVGAAVRAGVADRLVSLLLLHRRRQHSN